MLKVQIITAGKGLTAVLLSLVFLYGCKGEQSGNANKRNDIDVVFGNKHYSIPLNFETVKQEQSDRIWRDIEIKPEFKIGGINDTILYAPSFINVDEHDNIYILDVMDYCVKKFDKHGVFKKKFGKKGKGTGEFEDPFRFDILKNDKLAILDVQLNKCEIFENDSSTTIKLKQHPSSVCFKDENEISYLQVYNPGHSAIDGLNYKKNIITAYENIVSVKKSLSDRLGPLVFLDGFICKYKNGKIIYIPRYMNMYLVYSDHKKIIGAYNTIDDLELPSIGGQSVHTANFNLPDKYYSAMAANVAGDLLFIVAYQGYKKYKVLVADVYSLINGNYKYSIRFNKYNSKEMENLYLTEHRLFAVMKTAEVEVFSYKAKD